MLIWLLAIVVLLLVFASLRRGGLRGRRSEPGDYEAELVRLLRGDAREAERLIRHEMKTNGLSRPGAAMALVTRLRHEKDGYPPPL